MAVSPIILSKKIALLVPFPFTKPYSYSPISDIILLLILFKLIPNIILLNWLIILIVLNLSHFIVPGFFGMVINMERVLASRIWPVT